MFTALLAWAYPTAMRPWQAVLTLYDLPRNGCSITVSIITSSGKRHSLQTVDIGGDESGIGTVVALQLAHRLEHAGDYVVEFNMVGTTKRLRVPLRAVTQSWPKFSKKELDYLRASQGIPHSVRTNVICSGCSRPYVFEATPLPDYPFADGITPFPSNGTLECGSCGHILAVKDLEGQILASIKSALNQAMGEK